VPFKVFMNHATSCYHLSVNTLL